MWIRPPGSVFRSAGEARPDGPAPSGAGIRFLDASLDNMPRTAVTFLGDPPDEVERAFGALAHAAVTNGEMPIFVVTSFCFQLFRTRGLIAEYLPTPHRTEAAELSRYRRYIRSRYSHLLAKWNISSEIQIGLSLPAFIDAAVASATARDKLPTGTSLGE